MNKKLQLNSKFEFNNNFFFISPLLHEYSFFDPRSRPGFFPTANMPKAAAQSRVGKMKSLSEKLFIGNWHEGLARCEVLQVGWPSGLRR